MFKFIEAINNMVKLISSLAALAMLGGVVFGGLWVYHKVGELTSTPIKLPSMELPDVKLPKIQIEAPEIKLPSFGFGGEKKSKENDDYWEFLDDEALPPPPANQKPYKPDTSDVQV